MDRMRFEAFLNAKSRKAADVRAKNEFIQRMRGHEPLTKETVKQEPPKSREKIFDEILERMDRLEQIFKTWDN